MNVLHVDNHLLVVSKPAGLPCVPDSSEDESLLDRSKAWIKREFDKPGAVFLGVVHRLDRPVSGVVVFARTSKAAARLSKAFADQRVAKTYVALGQRPPREPKGEVEHWLRKDRERNRVSVVPKGTAQATLARTEFEAWSYPSQIRGEESERARFVLRPHTGRSHQLRVACASMGSPLLGDLRYGAAEPLNDKSIALHARRLELEHPTTREALTFEAGLPARTWWREAFG